MTPLVRPAPGVLEQVPLARYTSLRVGGLGRWFLASADASELARLLDVAAADGLPTLILGGGSNLLISDDGFDGAVLKYTATGHRVEAGAADTLVVRAAAGASFSNLARRLARDGVGTLEWAANVPGTVGGAVVNNAGAFGGCVADHLIEAEIVDRAGAVRTLAAEELAYAYRASVLKRGELGPAIVTSARLRARRADPAHAVALVQELQAKRTASQPRQLSAGSIFANPPGDYSGRLIEAAGLKGTRVGGAEISTHHANFIVNPGGATARDVYSLIRAAQIAVWERFGVWLRPEVQLVGRWSPDELAALAAPAGAERP
ncbi:MAG: UDP-N-acetylmuramate dehydrogenase [Chloroflexota bacterium]